MLATFSLDQYISLHSLNANLQDIYFFFFLHKDQGDFWPFFSCQGKDCLKRITKLHTPQVKKNRNVLGKTVNNFRDKNDKELRANINIVNQFNHG